MTIARPIGFQVIAVPAAPRKARSWPNRLRRILTTLIESRNRHAQRAVDEYVARRGSRLTDSLEREIGERMLGGRNFDR
jgi:hypothetical protein